MKKGPHKGCPCTTRSVDLLSPLAAGRQCDATQRQEAKAEQQDGCRLRYPDDFNAAVMGQVNEEQRVARVARRQRITVAARTKGGFDIVGILVNERRDLNQVAEQVIEIQIAVGEEEEILQREGHFTEQDRRAGNELAGGVVEQVRAGATNDQNREDKDAIVKGGVDIVVRTDVPHS